MNNKLTLLVFLKDRAAFTKRFVNYLSEIRYPFSVIFADGSLGHENEENFKSIKNVKFSYEYIRYDKDETLSNYYQKCALAIEKVNTPYVMLADNDDFPIIEGQLKAIDFLDKNSEYIGCNGRVSGIVINPVVQNPYGKHVLFLPFYCNTMDRRVSVDQDMSIDRIKAYLENFYSIFYSISRTENLAYTFRKIRELNFSDLGIVELFYSYTQLAQGKIHTIDSLIYVRQQGSSQAAASQKDWFHRLFHTNWLQDLKKAICTTTEYISYKENKEIQETYHLLFTDFVTRFRGRFVANEFYFCKNPQYIFNKIFFRHYILSKIFKILPTLGGKIAFYSLLPFTSKENLIKIREIIRQKVD
jgi:glycosyltransferase domain-containing protein